MHQQLICLQAHDRESMDSNEWHAKIQTEMITWHWFTHAYDVMQTRDLPERNVGSYDDNWILDEDEDGEVFIPDERLNINV